nr:nucleotide-binding alpha-beta plait domain-containing protein [Tanacetum cinerariifolium]
MDYNLAALKLFSTQLSSARPSHGLSQSHLLLGPILFQRAWIQGVVISLPSTTAAAGDGGWVPILQTHMEMKILTMPYLMMKGIFGDDDDAEDGREHQVNEDPIEEGEVMINEGASDDPFKIYPILNDKTKNMAGKGSSISYTHPPGFSHMKGQEDKQGMENNNTQGKEDATGLNKNDKESVQPKHIEEVSDSVSSGHFKKLEVSKTGGSILQLLDDVVKVGQVMGLKRSGLRSYAIRIRSIFLSLQETKIEVMDILCVKLCWGNMAFEYVHSDAVGNSGGFGVSIGDSVDKSPAMILDDECLVSSEFSNSLFGRVKEFASLANIKIALANEGFADISIQYLGEYWILVKFSSQDARQSFRDSVSVGSWFSILKEASSDFHCDKRIAWVETEGIPFKLWTENTFKRIASRWGVFLSVDDQEDSCFHSKRLCVHTTNTRSISEDFKIIFRGKVYWIRAKETPGKGSSSSYTHPPGFSHMKGQEDKQGMENNNTQGKEDATGLNKNDKESVQPKHIEE